MADRFHHFSTIAGTDPPYSKPASSNSASASNRVVDPQDHDSADNGDDQAPDVEARHSPSANRAEQYATNEGADDAEHEVGHKAGTAAVHDLARDPAGDEPKDDPGDDRHVSPLLLINRSENTVSPVLVP
jgi:hypothetical protein